MKKWLTDTAVPWFRWRMFRTGISADTPIVVTDRKITAATAITLFRLAGLPVFVYLVLNHQAWLASFLVFGTLAFLDSIDGYVARRYHQVSKIGGMLDHVADRATIATIAITLFLVDLLPLEVLVLIGLRDVVLLVIVMVLGWLGRPLPTGRVPVTRAGKLATMLLLVGLPMLVLHRTDLFGSDVIRWGAFVLTWAGIFFYYFSLVQYTVKGTAGSRPSDTA